MVMEGAGVQKYYEVSVLHVRPFRIVKSQYVVALCGTEELSHCCDSSLNKPNKRILIVRFLTITSTNILP